MKIVTLPFGYKREGKQIVIDEKQAEVVRFVFEKYAEGYGLYDLYYLLKEEGVKTNRGIDFKPSSISLMLDNHAYVGNYVYNKTVVKGLPKRKKLEENERKVVVGFFPQIIDNETFDRVREIKQFWNLRIKGGC